MYGVGSDGKIVLVNKDFSIHVPYGAGYDVGDPADDVPVLTIARFDELPANYKNGAFEPPDDGNRRDILNLYLTHEFDGARAQMSFPDFLEHLKRSTDERFARAAVGTVSQEDAAPNFRVLKVVQNTPDIKAGYLTSDLFVSVKFAAFLFTREHTYRGTLKIERQAQKLRRTEMFMKALFASLKPNSI